MNAYWNCSACVGREIKRKSFNFYCDICKQRKLTCCVCYEGPDPNYGTTHSLMCADCSAKVLGAE